MNNDISKTLANELVAMYRRDAAARLILDSFASRERRLGVIEVSEAMQQTGLGRNEVIRVFKELAELGCGRFWNGRKGQETRLQFTLGVKAIGGAAKGIAANGHQAPDKTGEQLQPSPTNSMRTYEYPLRSDLSATITLPLTLSLNEAQRLSGFIRTLVIE